jgi:hypothetical protein
VSATAHKVGLNQYGQIQQYRSVQQLRTLRSNQTTEAMTRKHHNRHLGDLSTYLECEMGDNSHESDCYHHQCAQCTQECVHLHEGESLLDIHDDL